MNKLYDGIEPHHKQMLDALSLVEFNMNTFKAHDELSDDWLLRTYHIVFHYYASKSKDGNIDLIIKECYPLVEIFYIKLFGTVENALEAKLLKLGVSANKMKSADDKFNLGIEHRVISSGDKKWMTDVRKLRNDMSHSTKHKMVAVATAIDKHNYSVELIEKINKKDQQ